ncbi:MULTISPECIES: hypothetical protein [unclassified Pseudanabaena]|uniref:hypothetical protein n=1 Tax=unclassified Pseudanabaena TaxID=2593292 RepID=UPI0006D7836D|nr:MULTISPECIES: hypothetical protein [unclassified Pseudanabaena]TYQ31952.1 hypothetical protein PseudUWO310_00230 [Pseudanabaena sp. UWO310]
MSTSNDTKAEGSKPEIVKPEEKSSRPTKAKAETETTVKTGTVDISALAVKEESQPVAASIEQKGSLIVTETLKHYGDRPIVDGGFRAVEYFNSSGERPIEASKLAISSTYTTMGGQRPITNSGVHVTGTFFSSGERPVVEDGFVIVDKFYMAGERPVGSSGLVVDETYSQMGGTRPVASNAIDSAGLMGYID